MRIAPAVDLLLRFFICFVINGGVLVLSYEDPDCKVRFSIQTSTVTRDDADMNEELWEYVEKCRRHAMKMKPIKTSATDKAVPASRAIQNSIISFPHIVAMICCPQVIEDTVLIPNS